MILIIAGGTMQLLVGISFWGGNKTVK